MRKALIVASLLLASLVGAGALTGQLGVTAAHAAAKHPSATKKAPTKKAPTTRQTSSAPHADGTVTAVSGDRITVKADNDPAGSTEYTNVTTIVLNGSTKYAAPGGTTTSTRPAIAVGDFIMAEGTVSGTTLTATLVSVGHGGHGGHGGPGGGSPHADGTITQVNGNTLTVQADNDPSGTNEYTKVTTIVLTSTTQYDAGKGASTTTKPTITAGEYIVAEGTLSNGDTTLTATHVSVGNKGGH